MGAFIHDNSCGLVTSFTDQQLLSAINCLPQFGEVTLGDTTRLVGGQCNVNVRVEQGTRQRLVRFLNYRDVANPIDRIREFRHQDLAAAYQLAPRPLAYYVVDELSAQNSQVWSMLAKRFSAVIVADYCAGASLASTGDVKSIRIEAIASLLASLHLLPYQPPTDVRAQSSPFTRLTHYWQLFCQQYPDHIARYDGIISQVLIEINNITISRHCLIHGDVNPGNIIIDQQQIQLIDWEYSDYNDPYIDLASTIAELELDNIARADFIAAYSLQCGEVSEQRLISVESYYCALCWLWSQLNHQQSVSAHSEHYYRRLLCNIRRTK